jgi:hypothetical protein
MIRPTVLIETCMGIAQVVESLGADRQQSEIAFERLGAGVEPTTRDSGG